MKTTGRKTAATENVAAVAAKAISRVPVGGGDWRRSLPLLAVAFDVFEYHDGVVDYDARRPGSCPGGSWC